MINGFWFIIFIKYLIFECDFIVLTKETERRVQARYVDILFTVWVKMRSKLKRVKETWSIGEGDK